MEVYEIFQLLEKTSSRNKKIDIIKQHEDNSVFKAVIKYALDGNLILGLKKIPEYDDTVEGIIDIGRSMAQLDKFYNNSVRGNDLIDLIRMILENSVPQERRTIERVISKDLKCGVSKATANKVFGKNFITDYPCMLANSYTDKNLEKIDFPCYAQIKSDGMRINLRKKADNTIEAKTRNGKLVYHRNRWNHFLQHIPPSVILDGEALVVIDGVIQDRKVGNGILNKVIKETATDEELDSVVFVFWDVITDTAFYTGVGETPYSDRIEILNTMFDETKFTTLGRVKISKTWKISDMSEATALFNGVVSEGGEGLVLKNIDSVWEDKRSKNLVKMKVENDADLVITDWVEGEGKYEGKMGALTASTADGKLVVNVGSGFTDEQREKYTSDVIGKVMTVKYNEIISDKKKKTKSLFLPIFVEMREDKDTANKLSELK